MTQEEKDYNLLLKDLSARLPYGVKVRYSSTKEFITCKLHSINPTYRIVDLWSKNACFKSVHISKIKPYLFPLSSITDEQKKEFDQLLELELKALNDEINHTQATAFEVDFYNKHHLDWRGLIPMDLAINATGLNIY